MVRNLLCLIAAASAGCSGFAEYCEEPHVVATSSDAQPGALRAAIALRMYDPGVATLSDGSVLCLTCTGFAKFDSQLRGSGGLADAAAMAVGPDDSIYAIVRGAPASSDLVALASDGSERWRTPVGVAPRRTKLIAAEGVVYAELPVAEQPTVVAFDAASGQRRELTAQRLIAAGRDSLFTVDGEPRTSTPTLRRLGPTGDTLWERTWRAADSPLEIYDAAATPEGGLIVVGRAEETIDFADRMLEKGPSSSLNFLAGVDATGATLWAFSLPVVFTTSMALTPAGDILLAGRTYTGKPDDGMDVFLAVATPAGVVRMHAIDGPGDQDVEDLTASPDGLAWLEVANTGGEDLPAPVLRVARHALDDSGAYLLAIVP